MQARIFLLLGETNASNILMMMGLMPLQMTGDLEWMTFEVNVRGRKRISYEQGWHEADFKAKHNASTEIPFLERNPALRFPPQRRDITNFRSRRPSGEVHSKLLLDVLPAVRKDYRK